MSFIISFLTSTVAKWVLRRIMELGGLLVLLGGLISTVDPYALAKLFDVLGKLLAGRFDEVSIAAVIGGVSLIWGLIWNARSTFKKPPEELPTFASPEEAVAAAEAQTGKPHAFTER